MIDKRYANRIGDAIFSLHNILFKKCAVQWRLRRRILVRHYLVYVKSGNVEATIDGRRHLVKPGRLLLLVPGSMVEARAASDAPPEFYLIEFSCRWSIEWSGGGEDDERPDALFRHGEELAVTNPVRIAHLLERLRGLGQAGHALRHWERQIEFQKLLYTAAVETEATAEPDNGGMSAAVAAIRQHLNEHYREQLSFKSLTAAFGISPTNFASVFKRQVGMTPHEYLTDLRIQDAKKRLAAGERMEEAARMTGYRDSLYFSRSFKKAVGVSPTLYVKQYRRERIMTLFPHMNDYLLALELSPHATLSYEGNDQVNGLLPYIADLLRGTRIVGGWERPDLQAVFKASPHLILGTDRNRLNVNNFSAIAPTVTIPLKDDWRSVLSELSVLFDRKEQLAKWLAHFERKVRQARERLAAAGKQEQTVVVLIAAHDELRLYGGRRQLGGILYRELQLSPPRGIALQDHYRRIGHEELAGLDPDHIFLATSNSNHRGDQVRSLKASPVWSALTAVRLRRVYEVPSWMNGHAPIQISLAVDAAVSCLLRPQRRRLSQ